MNGPRSADRADARGRRPATRSASRPCARPAAPRHERLAIDRIVADRQRLADVAEDHLLVGDQARQADRMDRHLVVVRPCPAASTASRISCAVRAAVPLGLSSLRSWCSSMISAPCHVRGGLRRELHHQHGADREVRRDEDVGALAAPRSSSRSKPVVPITTCTPAASACRAFCTTLVGNGEVDQHVRALIERLRQRDAERRVGTGHQLHVAARR